MPGKSLPSDPLSLKRLLSGDITEEQALELADRIDHDPGVRSAVSELLSSDTLDGPLSSVVSGEANKLPSPLVDAVNRLRKVSRQSEPATLSYSNVPHALPTGCEFLSPPQASDEIGRLGNYRILSVLGEGGMGMVFEAQDTKLKRRVALKTMRPEIAATSSAKDRFFREAEAAAALKHDNIVTIYQVDEENGIPYLAMEFLEGESLSDRLRRGEPLPMPLILHLGREVADGLSAAHEFGLVHRDIKPGNIWIEKRKGKGDLSRAKILDFGLARTMSGDVQLTKSGAVIGTPAYMSPEQARGRAVDHRADLFSLGVILYELTTGGRPFSGPDTMAILTSLALDSPPPPRELNPAVMPSFSNLIMKLLAKDAEGRPKDATEVAHLLRQIELGLAPTIEPMSQEVGTFSAPIPPPTRVSADPWADIDASSTDVIDSKQVEAAARSSKTGKHKPVKKDPTSKIKALTGTAKHKAVKAPAPEPVVAVSRKKWHIIAAAVGLLAAIIVIVIVTRGKKNPTTTDTGDKSGDIAKQPKVPGGKSIAPDLGNWVNVIPLVDTKRDKFDHPTFSTGKNQWSLEKGELKYSGDAAHGLLRLPVKPIGRIVEVEVTATRTLGGQSFVINVPAKNGPVPVDFGQKNEVRIGWPFRRIGSFNLQSGIKTTFLLKVSRTGNDDLFEVFVDGRAIGEWRGDREKIAAADPAKESWQEALNLWVNPMSDWTFHQIRIRVSADGKSAAIPAPPGDYSLAFEKGDKVEIPGLKIDRIGDVTVEAFITPSVGVYPLNVHVLGVDGQITLNVSSDQWYFHAFQGSTTSPAPLVAGKRVHVAGVRTTAQRRLYIDGKLAASISDSKIQAQETTAPFVIGGSSFTGLIDEVRVSNFARYTKDFQPAARHDFDYNTQALYHCDEGANNVLKDSSANGLDGRISGTKWVNPDGTEIKSLGSSTAVSPFDAAKALEYQEAAAKQLGIPVEFSNSLGMNFRLLPAGKFVMGSPNGESGRAATEGPQHPVTLSRPYYLGIYEVTYGVYATVTKGKAPNASALRMPAGAVSWNAAVAFCELLSSLPEEKAAGRVYRLPTEAEWEFACRAGTTTAHHFGDAFDETKASGTKTQTRMPVGSFPPNAFGFFDMHGNVWEWCSDWFTTDFYKDSPDLDPKGPETRDGKSGKVLRGGGASDLGEVYCRSAARGFRDVDHARVAVGIRVVCEVSKPDGFTPLFNGKDLTGWITSYGGTGQWKVEDGAITCTGQPSYLYSQRGDYTDFHLRVEARVNDGGNSGVFFRVDNPLVVGQGYEAQVCGAAADKQRTGSLHTLLPVGSDLVAPFEWFTMEIIAQGPKVEIRVNGKNACGYTDQKKNRLSGFLALQHYTEGTKVFFRKIEIKELRQ